MLNVSGKSVRCLCVCCTVVWMYATNFSVQSCMAHVFFYCQGRNRSGSLSGSTCVGMPSGISESLCISAKRGIMFCKTPHCLRAVESMWPKTKWYGCRDEIENPSCKARVTKVKELAASDIRFDIPLAEACYDDRRQFCSGVPPGSARVIRCLQDRYDRSVICSYALCMPHTQLKRLLHQSALVRLMQPTR